MLLVFCWSFKQFKMGCSFINLSVKLVFVIHVCACKFAVSMHLTADLCLNVFQLRRWPSLWTYTRKVQRNGPRRQENLRESSRLWKWALFIVILFKTSLLPWYARYFWNVTIYVAIPEQTHLNQVESDYKDKLEKEVSARKEVEKVCILSCSYFSGN